MELHIVDPLKQQLQNIELTIRNLDADIKETGSQIMSYQKKVEEIPKREQELLLQHKIIVWQHPFYWYSSPALLKEWIDLVLEHGWAYGRKGDMLKGKKVNSGARYF